MADVTLRGNPITLGGSEVKAGQSAPDFTALDNGLKPVKLSDAKGKVVILSSVPSLDTPTCDTETRRFNQEAAKLARRRDLTISRDSALAQKRWRRRGDGRQDALRFRSALRPTTASRSWIG
jgi:thiol peroxidase